jgi:hypothetical protein
LPLWTALVRWNTGVCYRRFTDGAILLEEAPRLIHEVVKALVAAVDELTGTRHGVLDLLEREAGWLPRWFFFGHGCKALRYTPCGHKPRGLGCAHDVTATSSLTPCGRARGPTSSLPQSRALGRKHVAPYEDGVVYLMVDDVARDREVIEDALDGAGDDRRDVVRLRG